MPGEIILKRFLFQRKAYKIFKIDYLFLIQLCHKILLFAGKESKHHRGASTFPIIKNTPMEFETLLIDIKAHVATVKINVPKKANAMTVAFWKEIKEAMEALDQNEDVRVIIVAGEGKHFTSGIDLTMFMQLKSELDKNDCPARSREQLRQTILRLQSSFNAIEKCRKPVIAAIHGACIGGGIDMIAACDMRYCSADAYFTVKEIDLGMVADVGTLQRLPKIIGEGIARELAYTGRKVSGKEAQEMQLVNKCYDTPEALHSEVHQIAETIAAKSPIAIRGTKEMFLYTRDHSVDEGLNYIATWNAGMLFSKDLQEAAMAGMQKRTPNFAN